MEIEKPKKIARNSKKFAIPSPSRAKTLYSELSQRPASDGDGGGGGGGKREWLWVVTEKSGQHFRKRPKMYDIIRPE